MRKSKMWTIFALVLTIVGAAVYWRFAVPVGVVPQSDADQAIAWIGLATAITGLVTSVIGLVTQIRIGKGSEK